MKNRIMIVLAIIIVLLLFAGCTQAPAVVAEKDEMAKEETQEIKKVTDETKEMEEPKEEMEAPKEEMEEPKEEMEKASIGEMTEVGYIDLTPEEAFKLIESTPDLVVVDVSPKYDEGHLPGAVNYYIGDGSLDEAIPNLDMNVPYLVYCHFDSASIPGATKLVEAGFSPVYRLIGNYSAWVDAGYPVEK